MIELLILLLAGLGACLAWTIPGTSRRAGEQISSLKMFENVAQEAPFSIWAEREKEVSWANTLCLKNFGSTETKFSGISGFRIVREEGRDQRNPLYEWNQSPKVTSTSYSIQTQKLGDTTIYYAQDATLLTETENELKRFIQTLSSTFAHLPIGLAVFDKQRDLTLFNPALSHLLGLAPEWLARKPSLRAFLDRLRNVGAIPEPKDFTSLRHEFANLESGAFVGEYEVEWALPSGSIYRVVGRPHPQGGAALLFEDVSKSAALEAGYRAELRQWYTAFDSLSEAVAIFDQAGELAFSNDAFDNLWGCSFSNAVAPTTINDVSRLFQKNTVATPVWGELRNFVHDLTERSQWSATVTLLNGQKLDLFCSPIADGRVLCEFKMSIPQASSLRELQNA